MLYHWDNITHYPVSEAGEQYHGKNLSCTAEKRKEAAELKEQIPGRQLPVTGFLPYAFSEMR